MKRSDPRHILTYLSPFLDLKKLINRSIHKIIFPFYHAVTNHPGPHLVHLYPIKSVEAFTRDLEKLLKYFEPLSPEILLSGDKEVKEPGFILTFDDGLREVREQIAPILLKKGIPAIFFLNNDFVDNEGLFYRYKVSLITDSLKRVGLKSSLQKELLKITGKQLAGNERAIIRYVLGLSYTDSGQIDEICNLLEINIERYLESQTPYLDSDEIRELRKQGFFLGAHSFSHPEFFNLNPSEQVTEITESTKEICKKFELEYSFFAFPFTDYGVGENVYRKIFSRSGEKPHAIFGTAGIGKHREYPVYQRISMEKYRGDSEKILKTEYFYSAIKRRMGR